MDWLPVYTNPLYILDIECMMETNKEVEKRIKENNKQENVSFV